MNDTIKHNYNDPSATNYPDKQDEIADTLKKQAEIMKHDIYRLAEVYTELLGTEGLGNYCCYTNERQECTDGSDLYTIIKYEGRDLIVKVGAGEFNIKVFTTGNIKELKWFYMSPIPLFVVDQGHSYLGDKKDLHLKKDTPIEYLNRYAVLVSPKWWEAYYRSHNERHEKNIDYNNIQKMNYDDALATWRITLLHKTFPSWEINEVKVVKMMKRLKDMDFEQFYKQIWKGEKFLSEEMKKLIGCLWRMGVNRCWSGVGDKDAYQSLYNLIQTYDTQKQIFTKPYN